MQEDEGTTTATKKEDLIIIIMKMILFPKTKNSDLQIHKNIIYDFLF